MRPWMLACDWIIVSDCRRLDAWVQLDWTRQILTPSSRILLSDKSSASNAGVWTSQIFVCVKMCAADCRRLDGVRSMNRALVLHVMFTLRCLAIASCLPSTPWAWHCIYHPHFGIMFTIPQLGTMFKTFRFLHTCFDILLASHFLLGWLIMLISEFIRQSLSSHWSLWPLRMYWLCCFKIPGRRRQHTERSLLRIFRERLRHTHQGPTKATRNPASAQPHDLWVRRRVITGRRPESTEQQREYRRWKLWDFVGESPTTRRVVQRVCGADHVQVRSERQ